MALVLPDDAIFLHHLLTVARGARGRLAAVHVPMHMHALRLAGGSSHAPLRLAAALAADFALVQVLHCRAVRPPGRLMMYVFSSVYS